MKNILALAVILFTTLGAIAQGTAFTYQGRLNSAGSPASGQYDFQFKLYADSLGSTQVGGSYVTNAISANGGLFTVALDFGSGIFTGSNYWLEVDVKTNTAAIYTVLTPLQAVTATPYAIMANSASNLLGALPTAQLSGTILNGSLPASPNFSGTVTANSFSGNGANLTALNANNLSIGTVPLAQLPIAVLTNNQKSVTIGGTNAVASLTVPPNVPSSAVGSVVTGSQPFSLAVAGRYAYVVNYLGNTLQIFDMSNPSSPVSVGSVATGSGPQSVAVAGRYAYVVNYGSNTMQIFDVGNPSSPVSIAVATGSGPTSVAVAGRYAYVANFGNDRLQIFDVSNPSSPVSVGSVATGNTPYSVAVA
jgi:hypothetical protein